MKNKIIFFFAIAMSLAQTTFAHELTLCAQTEKVILSCPVEGKTQKIMSLCACPETSNLSNELNYIEYRFGKHNKIEMKYKITPSNKNEIFRSLNDGTYSLFFGFKVGDYSYLIETPQEVAGAHMNITVLRKTETKGTILCKPNEWIEDKNIKSNLIKDTDWDSFENKFILNNK